MIDFVRATMNSEVNNALKTFVTKIIAAILIFMIPTFVNILANLSSNDGGYLSCLKNATKEGVREAYEKEQSKWF